MKKKETLKEITRRDDIHVKSITLNAIDVLTAFLSKNDLPTDIEDFNYDSPEGITVFLNDFTIIIDEGYLVQTAVDLFLEKYKNIVIDYPMNIDEIDRDYIVITD